jgi:Flp pilus assembly protein TadG
MNRSKGAILLEFAFVLPIFALLILGGMDLMRLENAKSDLDSIAITTSGCFVAGNCGTDVQTYARNLASGFLMAASATTMTCSANTCTAHYAWQPLSPFLSSAQLTATATAATP